MMGTCQIATGGRRGGCEVGQRRRNRRGERMTEVTEEAWEKDGRRYERKR